jgi:DNA topoisomerase-1
MTRLVTVTRDDLTIVRRRQGKGFAYIAADGRLVTDPEARDRLLHLGIPPAWQDVRIAAHPRAHLQCCGVDEAGRVQYIYHPDWERRRAAHKQVRLADLTAALPKLRRRLARDMRAEAGEIKLALAIGVALIDRTAMRVGRERYLLERGTRGAGTLYSRDIRVEGDDVCITFPAKSGKVAEYRVADPRLVEAIIRIKTLPGKRLLVHRNAAGRVVPIKSEMINTYLRGISGAEISGKDFRTLHASALAGEALARLEPADSQAERKRQIASVTQEVADLLRNTPMICRKSYIAPFLFQLFDKGKLQALWSAASRSKGPRAREVRLGALLSAIG